jgi:D-alanyl-D-alanine carboxypeptidase
VADLESGEMLVDHKLMLVFAKRPDAERWRDALPIMGVDGLIAEVGKYSPARGHVHTKTGTLGDADLLNGRLRLESKALAGYVDPASGRRLAVAIVQTQAMFRPHRGCVRRQRRSRQDRREPLHRLLTGKVAALSRR